MYYKKEGGLRGGNVFPLTYRYPTRLSITYISYVSMYAAKKRGLIIKLHKVYTIYYLLSTISNTRILNYYYTICC